MGHLQGKLPGTKKEFAEFNTPTKCLNVCINAKLYSGLWDLNPKSESERKKSAFYGATDRRGHLNKTDRV